MTYQDIIKEISKKVFRPVYFLYGTEPYFIDSLVHQLSESILDPTERGFNQSVIYGRDVVMSDLVPALKSFPMMSNYQVVIIREAQEIRDKDIEVLAAGYMSHPQPSTILVMAYKKAPGKKLSALLAKHSNQITLFESPRVSDDKLADWIIRYLGQKNYVCSPKIAQVVAGSLGNDLAKISNELDKLMINLPDGSTVTMDDVEANIGISKKYNVFELQAALAGKQAGKALEIASYFSANIRENSLFALIPNLFAFFERLFIYHQMRGSASPDELAAVMKIKKFFLSEYNKASQHYSMLQALGVIKLLRTYEAKAKGVGSVAPENELLREMIYKIVHI